MAMVSEKVNGAEPAEIPQLPVEKPEGLPPGKYVLVGWDVDTTGRRLVDEICQIAAYSPKNTYSQYIMPYRDLNPGARRRHNIRVVTVGRYRMLKDTITNKILKTKSEISALTDFLVWLEKERGDAKSVILIHHELHRLSPIMLLEALQRYNLVDRFKAVVSGFADSYALASERCRATVKSVSLRVLARVLLDADTLAVESALDRATAAYRIVEHLAQGEQQDVGAVGEGPAATGDMAETARIWSRTVDTELNSLNKLKSLLEKQNTFRPVFAPLLGTQRNERLRVTALRRLLADAGILYEQVKSAWENEKIEGLQKQMASLSQSAKQEDITELIDILDCHFDPAKESKCLKTKTPRKPRTSTSEAPASVSNNDTSSSQQSPSKNNNGITTEQQQQVL